MVNEQKTGKIQSFRFPLSLFRNLVQFLAFLALNLLAFRFVYPFIEANFTPIPIPVLSSLKSSYTMLGGSVDYFQVMLSHPLFPIIPLAIILVIGSVFGRFLCGWICPMGFIQDLILKMKAVTTKVSLRKHVSLIKLKYFILFLVLFFSSTLALSLFLEAESRYQDALGPFAEGILLPIEPETTLFSTIPRLVQTGMESGLLNFSTLTSSGYIVLLGFILLAIFFVGAYMVPWFWCRYVCPTGALMAIPMRFSFLGLKRDPSKCTKCGDCVAICPMQIKILDLPWEKFNDPECTLCLECMGACSSGALSAKIS
ncbi:4Fe-4S binding protein [[Eubacterium] cellulosolvens]